MIVHFKKTKQNIEFDILSYDIFSMIDIENRGFIEGKDFLELCKLGEIRMKTEIIN